MVCIHRSNLDAVRNRVRHEVEAGHDPERAPREAPAPLAAHAGLRHHAEADDPHDHHPRPEKGRADGGRVARLAQRAPGRHLGADHPFLGL